MRRIADFLQRGCGRDAAWTARSSWTPGTPGRRSTCSAPKEKVWGLLLSLGPPARACAGIDLGGFDDWMRQEARGDEPLIGLVDPLLSRCTAWSAWSGTRRSGPLLSYADRFAREVGRSVFEVLGVRDRGERSSAPAAVGLATAQEDLTERADRGQDRGRAKKNRSPFSPMWRR